MTTVTLNGHVYSADKTGARDLSEGGHKTWFIPMMVDFVASVGSTATDAATAAAAAVTAAAAAASLTGTSVTSLTIATGSTGTIGTQSGKQFTTGVFVLIYRTSDPTKYMYGQVTSYSTTNLVVNVLATGGSGGPYTDWTIAVSGVRGATGADGPAFAQQYVTKTSTFTIDSTYQGDLVDCTTGGYTPTWTAAATLTSSFWFEMKNSSTTDVTIDPNGAETCDGLSSFVMYPGEHRRFFCNGSNFTSIVLNPFYKVFTGNGTFTKPPGYKVFGGLLWGSGGGGAVGAGAPGGGGGSCAPFTLPASVFGTTETITIGAATSGSTTATPTAGNVSTLGSLVRANGARAATSANGGSAYLATSLSFSGITHTTAGPSGPTLLGGGDGAQTSAGYGTVYGGAGGAKQGDTAIPTTFGGAGGAAGTTGVGSPGTAPGGGGGATNSGANGGGGALGELRIWGMI